MEKLLGFAKSGVVTRIIVTALCFGTLSCSCGQAQGLTMDEMLRMTGSSEPHLGALQNRFATQASGQQTYSGGQRPAFSGNRGSQSAYDIDSAYGTRATSGAYGEFGNSTANRYNYAQQNVEQYDYQGETANQAPISRGGLPATTTAIQSQSGSFGGRFGSTQIASGRFSYGFSQGSRKVYRGVSGNRNLSGRALPPVSTGSVDINIVDR